MRYSGEPLRRIMPSFFFGDEELLWADAICINQMDPVEKASQILHMGEIYSQAHRVVVWLGKDTAVVPDIAEFRRNLDTAIDK
jgi:hypothetical protein